MKDQQQENKKRFSPREFLRARRPERFSDSITGSEPILDRQILEYNLDSLTSRSQETDFEDFARRLAQNEICPNLIPHTGPTGGGDSKVDSETYPVADVLSFAWYVGNGREAANERWAFAFSAKKDWRDKVKADIAKIAATQRDYCKAFYISNQFIPDKIRAEVEDQLREKHKLDVRILDRSWILDRIFSSKLEELAIDSLKLSPSLRKVVQKGPLDLQRERDLNELETRIKDASQQGRFGLRFVDDCIEASELSRELERPREETEGRFLRAQRAAELHGGTHQRLVVAYGKAWTAYWWHEDFKAFASYCADVEKLASGSRNVYDLELLFNLWVILYTLVKKKHVEESNLDSLTGSLAANLDSLSTDTTRPSASLQARSLRLLMTLNIELFSKNTEAIDNALHSLQDIVRQSDGLIGFPFQPLVEILTELGHVLEDRPASDELFETMLKISASRDGEVSAARMLCKRGADLLKNDKPYDAIRKLGRALVHLFKHESRHDLIRALYICGSAYERVGLLWAARGSLVTAASLAIDEFWKYSDVTPMQAACCNRLKWIELQLGRLPHALTWHEIDSFLKNILAEKGYSVKHLLEGEIEFEIIMGIPLLKADMWQLKQLSQLPDVLDKLGLENTGLALRFALGYEDELPKALLTGSEREYDHYTFYTKWRDQAASADMPNTPALYEGRTIDMESKLLGCRIMMKSDNVPACILLAESILAALESLLATGFSDHLVSREPIFTITIQKSDFAKTPFSFELKEPDGRPNLIISCRDFDPHSLSMAEQGDIRNKIMECLIYILSRIFFHGNIEDLVMKLFRDEHAAERALCFTGSFVTLGNVLGRTPKTSISAWVSPDAKEYPLRRSKEWDSDYRKTITNKKLASPNSESISDKDEKPMEIPDVSHLKHTEIKTVSFIRETLWDNAEWSGTAFMWSPGDSNPPILAFLFRDKLAAGMIFSNWRKEIGKQDHGEILRISIIRHINKKAPHWYRVIVGTNPDAILGETGIKRAVMVSRINTMEPSSDYNLTEFLRMYNRFGGYFLAYGIFKDGQSPESIFDNCIIKRKLYVREAWEIGRYDQDAVGIFEDDDPIIPPDQKDAPLVELLKWQKSKVSNQ